MKPLKIYSPIRIADFILPAALCLCFLIITTSAQTLSSSTDANTPSGMAPGSPAGSYALTGFENVNLFNGNVNFSLPLLKVGGRGEAQMPINFNLDSVHWKTEKLRISGSMQGAPPCPGGTRSSSAPESCYRLVVDQGDPSNPGVYWSSNPYGWDWDTKTQYSPGILHGRRSGVHTGGTTYFSTTVAILTFTAQDGTEYQLRDQPTSGQFQTATATGFNRGKIFTSFNGEAVTFISDSDIYDSRLQGSVSEPFYPSGVLWLANGSRYQIVEGLVMSIRDRNGNEMRFTYLGNRVETITDSLNRTVSFAYTTTADTITYSGFGGTPRTVTVQWTSMSNVLRPQSGYTITSYQGLFDLNGNTNAEHNPDVASEIILPDNRRYKLFYNPYGELARVELPTGGAIEYDYTLPEDSLISRTGWQIYRRVLERRVYSNGGTGNSYDLKQTFAPTYSGDGTAGSPLKTTIAVEQRDANDNFLSKDAHYFEGSPIASLFGFAGRTSTYSGWNEGKETKTESYSSSGAVLRTTENIYAQKSNFSWWTGTAASEPANDPRLVRTEITLNDTGQKAKTEYAYDDFNNQTEVKEYDYGNNAFGGLLRRTATGYVDATTLINSKNYTCAGANCASNQETIHLRRLPRQTAVYDSSDNIAAFSIIEYDNYGSDARHAALATRSNITGSCLTRDFINSGGNCVLGSTDGYLTRGNSTSVTSYGNAQSQTEAVTVSSKYDVAGNVVETKDAKGYVSTIGYNDNFGAGNGDARTHCGTCGASGQNTFAFATSATNSIGYTIYRQFDYSSGLTVDSEDINGNVSSAFYNDNLDRPTQVILANNRSMLRNQKTFAYDDSPTVRKITVTADLFAFGDNLAKTVSFYDKMGRTYETWNYKDGGYVIGKQEYDALGRAYKQSNPYRGSETVYWRTSEFDALGRVKKVITPDTPVNAEVNTSYLGNAVTVTDQAGKQRRSVTNAVGQLKQVDEPDAAGALVQSTTYDYDALNNLTQVNQGVQTRTFVYDGLSRLKTAMNPELGNTVGGVYVPGSIQYSYDLNGNLLTKIDPRDVKTTYAYDDLNRALSRTYTLSNGSALPANLATPNVAYTYDETTVANSKGKLTKVSSSVSETRYTAFDQLGRVTASEQRTPFSDTETVANATPRTSNYVYNLSGALIEQTYPSTRVVKNVLGQDGELVAVQSKKITNSGFWNYAKALSYTAAGSVSSLQLGNGKWQSTQYNNRLQPTQIALGTTPGATDLLKLDYQYGKLDAGGQTISGTNNGNVSKQTITVPTGAQGNGFTAVQYYAYDHLNRIKQTSEAMTPNGQSLYISWTQTFDYERYGNRTFDEANTTTLPKNCVNGSSQPIVCAADNPTANTQNNRLNGLTFDSAGNTTIDATGKTFTYDAENKQTEIKNASNQSIGRYFYDGSGKRVRKYVPATGETTVFIYDASDKLVAEYSTIVASTTDAKVDYLTTDRLGSSRIDTDQNGKVTSRHDYQPFGEEVTVGRGSYGTDSVRQKFTGYEKDTESGLDFAQARYFNSNFGRFSSPDDFKNDSHTSDPQSWNLYAYVRNNPLLYVDPNGKKLWISTGNISVQYVKTDSGYKFVDGDGNDYQPEKGSTMARVAGFISSVSTETLDKLINTQPDNIITVKESEDGSTSSESHPVFKQNNIIQVVVTGDVASVSPDGVVRTQQSTGLVVTSADGTAGISDDNIASSYAFNNAITGAANLLGKPWFGDPPSNYTTNPGSTPMQRLTDSVQREIESGDNQPNSQQFRGTGDPNGPGLVGADKDNK